MQYSSFNQKKFDFTKQPMFFGEPVNVARYDKHKYPHFEKLTRKQISFLWKPEEATGMNKDKADFEDLSPAEKHIFVSNLQYQTLLDSVQSRSPNVALLPVVSLPELETWIETWAFFETIHSYSYTFILKSMGLAKENIFDSIISNEAILKRASSVSRYYDDFIEYSSVYNLLGLGTHTINGKQWHITSKELKRKLFLLMVSINILEGIRFYVSFACTFSFGKMGILEGNSNIVKWIARDETTHLAGTQYMIQLMKSGEDDEEMGEVAQSCEQEVKDQFRQAKEQEIDWAQYLFKDGTILGLNHTIVDNYLQYLTNLRMRALGYDNLFAEIRNPLPWMDDWFKNESLQVAPQETNITDYVRSVDTNIGNDDIDDLFDEV